jgi:hypothetical protein
LGRCRPQSRRFSCSAYSRAPSMTDELLERRLLRTAAEEGLAPAAARPLVRHVMSFVPLDDQEEYLRFAIRNKGGQSPIIHGHDDRFGTSAAGVEPPDIQPPAPRADE